jgi:hypothetical protein
MKKFAAFLSAVVLLCALCASSSFAQKSVDLGMSKFGIRHVRIPLTAAQLIGMYAAPIKILDPQGAGKTIIVTKVSFTITRTATAFTGGGAVIVQYGSTVNGGGTQSLDSTLASTVITGAAGTTVSLRNGAVISDLAAASIQNAPLYLSNQTAAFATGTGTGMFDVWYYVNGSQ